MREREVKYEKENPETVVILCGHILFVVNNHIRKFHAALYRCRAVLLARVDALCEFLEATSSDTDEEQLHRKILNPFLDMLTSL